MKIDTNKLTENQKLLSENLDNLFPIFKEKCEIYEEFENKILVLIGEYKKKGLCINCLKNILDNASNVIVLGQIEIMMKQLHYLSVEALKHAEIKRS